jgi:hypothetical protein
MTINEEFLYYLWQNKKFDHVDMFSSCGQKVEIINYGYRNVSSGPDFHNAKIKIGETIWAGNVEMHVLTSDWQRHNHQGDAAYNNVILHVVYRHDKEINNLPVLELHSRIDSNTLTSYDKLMNATQWISCEQSLPYVTKEKLPLWATQFAIARLEGKYQILKLSPSYATRDWQQLLYEKIARYFGATHNSDVFESIAQRLPYTIILKNKYNSLIIESMLLGVGGLLEEDIDDEYFLELKKEFAFQKTKYKLTQINKVQWKNFGMYIWGTPAYRLAQLSAFLYNSEHIFDQILSAPNASAIKNIFQSQPSQYWHNHYNFGKTTKPLKNQTISDDLIDRIIINAIIPVLFAYAKEIDNQEIIEHCLDMLSAVKSEDNSIIKKWKAYGFKPTTALDSQALIELKTNYCDYKQCLQCPIGREILH